MLAKAVVLQSENVGMYRPLREQARSYGYWYNCVKTLQSGSSATCPGLCRRGRIRCLLERGLPAKNDNAVGLIRNLWERACSRRRWSCSCKMLGCTGLFASKLAPTWFIPVGARLPAMNDNVVCLTVRVLCIAGKRAPTVHSKAQKKARHHDNAGQGEVNRLLGLQGVAHGFYVAAGHRRCRVPPGVTHVGEYIGHVVIGQRPGQ